MSTSTTSPPTGWLFGRLAEQSPLTGHEPDALNEVSSEAIPIVLPSRRCSLDTNADDLAVTLDGSEACDGSDTGRLTSPLSSQEREVSADPFVASFSHSHSSMGKPRSSRDSGSVKGSQMENARFLSERSKIHDFHEWKGDQAFQRECGALTKLSEAQFELDRS